jgi:hypothetical protein
MTTHVVSFYAGGPKTNGFSNSGNFIYTGRDTHAGTATITDTERGIEGQTLDDADSTGGAETATATVTVGNRVSTRVRVEAEEVWLVRDNVTGEVFNVAEFRVAGGQAAGSYTLSERPLVTGRSYTILDRDSNSDATDDGDPVFTYAEYVCFAAGTLIRTPGGEVAVEALRAGDDVVTLDHGIRPLIWTGSRTLVFPPAPESQKPIRIKAGCLGANLPCRDLVVSPQHRILCAGQGVTKLTGQHEVFVAVKSLEARNGVRRMKGTRQVTYHSLLFDRHEVILANGLAAESLFPGPTALKLLSPMERLQLLLKLPDLTDEGSKSFGPPARAIMRHQTARQLVLQATFTCQTRGPRSGAQAGPAVGTAQASSSAAPRH